MSTSSKIIVEAHSASYPIYIGRNLESAFGEELHAIAQSGAKVAVITHESIRAALPALFAGPLADAPVLSIPDGEKSKSIEQFSDVLDFLAASGLDRQGVLIAVGGGVIGDLGGYAAASYLRGIRFIQVPTTLLAMVDSSVGGKTGINIAAGKNLVGAFWQPHSVYADLAALSSLPPRQFSSGMAEVIKYGLLASASLFDSLSGEALVDPEDARLISIVEECCQIKADIVKADEKEQATSGGRALLNLGHTFAHAIENVAGYGSCLHGEAVAIGMVAAARLSEALGSLTDAECERVSETIVAHRLPAQLSEPLAIDSLLQAMYRDKKVKAGKLRFVTMDRIGEAVTNDLVEESLVRSIWKKVGAA